MTQILIAAFTLLFASEALASEFSYERKGIGQYGLGSRYNVVVTYWSDADHTSAIIKWDCGATDGIQDSCNIFYFNKDLTANGKKNAVISQENFNGTFHICTILELDKGIRELVTFDMNPGDFDTCAHAVQDLDEDGQYELVTPNTYLPRSAGAMNDYPMSNYYQPLIFNYVEDKGLVLKVDLMKSSVEEVIKQVGAESGMPVWAALDNGFAIINIMKHDYAKYHNGLMNFVFKMIYAGQANEIEPILMRLWPSYWPSMYDFLKKCEKIFVQGAEYQSEIKPLNNGDVLGWGFSE